MYFFKLMLPGIFFLSVAGGWQTDFETAKTQAKQEHKLILLNFSGSDWCGPCIRLEKEIFESEDFKQYANGRLVLVNADFPRLRKHQLSPAQQKKNDALAEKYNPNGIFPSTLLLDEEGHILKTWEGFPPVSPSEFVNQVKTVADARN